MTNLLECCKINSKKVSEYIGTKKYVATGDINEDTITGYTEYTFSDKPSRANLSIEENSILFAKMMNTKKILLGTIDNKDYIYSTGFYSVKADETIIKPKLLYYYFFSDYFNKQKDKYSTGATMKGINDKGLKKILINVPDLNVQDTYINEFDNLFEMLKIRKSMISDLDLYIESLFKEKFGNILHSEFESKTLDELVDKKNKNSLKRGPFGGSLKKSDFVDDGYLVYEQRHAIHNDFAYEKYYINEEKFNEMRMFEVFPGDMLISCSGATLGRISEVPKNAKKGIINQALLKISLNNDIILNKFFIHQFRSNEMQDQLFGFSRGAGIPNFPSMSEVKKLKFICPEINKQRLFVNKVEEVNKIKDSYLNDIKDIEQLINKKMNDIFSCGDV